MFGGVYMSRDRLAVWRAGAPDPVRWIVISRNEIPHWASEGGVRTTGGQFRDHGRRGAVRCCTARARDHDTAVLHRRSRSLLARGLATDLHMYGTVSLSHTGRETQDEARAALHGVRILQARRVRAASRGTVRIATDARQVAGDLAGVAVEIAPVSNKIPCKQGISQGISPFIFGSFGLTSSKPLI